MSHADSAVRRGPSTERSQEQKVLWPGTDGEAGPVFIVWGNSHGSHANMPPFACSEPSSASWVKMSEMGETMARWLQSPRTGSTVFGQMRIV